MKILSSLHLLQKVIGIFCSLILFLNIEFLVFGGQLDAEILTQFVDAGGNVLVAGSNSIGK
jgi:hypothetical protein